MSAYFLIHHPQFNSGMREYDSFMQKIQETTDRFEVHSLIVQRRLKQNGQPLEFDDVGFTDQLNEEVVSTDPNIKLMEDILS